MEEEIQTQFRVVREGSVNFVRVNDMRKMEDGDVFEIITSNRTTAFGNQSFVNDENDEIPIEDKMWEVDMNARPNRENVEQKGQSEKDDSD